MNRSPLLLACLSVTLLTTPPATLAQDTPPAAPPAAAGVATMEAVIVAVEGTVRVRLAPGEPWVAAEPGMKLREGATLRTGPRSAIRCMIGEEHTFVLDRLGTIELTEALRDGNLVKTNLTMKYGRAQYEVQKAGLDHDAKISTPGATLAVRGTIGEVDNSPPFRPVAVSYTGRVFFSDERRSTTLGGPGSSRVSVEAGQQSVAAAALLGSIVDPQSSRSRTPTDSRVISEQRAIGANAFFDFATQIPVVRGGPGPTVLESDLVTSLPGRLNFVARWTGDADLNLQVGVSRGDPASTVLTTGEFRFSEFIYPGFGLNVSPSGGRTDFDHRGGPNGGQEIVYWRGNFPIATYALGIVQVSGEPTPLTVNAFLDGRKIAMFDFAPTVEVSPEGVRSTTYTYRMTPNAIVSPLVFIPLADDHPFNQIPDANEGRLADLGASGPITGADLRASGEPRGARPQRGDKPRALSKAGNRSVASPDPALQAKVRTAIRGLVKK